MLAGLLVSAVAFVFAIVPPGAAAMPLLSHKGRWLTDRKGRVVILHGVQIDRYPPGKPFEYIDLHPAGVRFIAGEGFNVARVSIAYSGVEPQMGKFDSRYVQQYLDFDRKLDHAGVYDLVDMMQGQYGAQFEGAGFPDWMTFTDGAPNTPGPFPQSYLYDPAEERAWDNFWANRPAADGMGLQDHYARGLRYLAQRFAAAPAFAGFDLINEPWAGSHWPSCANPAGCPVFDRMLQAFYKRIIPSLRTVDRSHPVFYEPHALFDQGAATNIGSVGDPNAVFTFHNYCLGDQPGLPQADPGQNCNIEEQMVLGNAEAQGARTGDGLLQDEWGNTNDTVLLGRMADEADGRMVGWSYWAYEDCCNSPGRMVYDGAKSPTVAGNLNVPVIEALARPYPKVVAGTPSPWSFDHAGGLFKFTYFTNSVTGAKLPAGADTEIELPAVQYPTGYSARVTGARVLSAPDSNLLRLRNRSAVGTVTVTVTRARHHAAAPGPFRWPKAAHVVATDCPSSSRHAIPIRYLGRGKPAVDLRVYIDGRRVARLRGRPIRAITLPAGLADGTVIRVVASFGGKHPTARRQLLACALRPNGRWTIRIGRQSSHTTAR